VSTQPGQVSSRTRRTDTGNPRHTSVDPGHSSGRAGELTADDRADRALLATPDLIDASLSSAPRTPGLGRESGGGVGAETPPARRDGGGHDQPGENQPVKALATPLVDQSGPPRAPRPDGLTGAKPPMSAADVTGFGTAAVVSA
jgi:hypothetical protein